MFWNNYEPSNLLYIEVQWLNSEYNAAFGVYGVPTLNMENCWEQHWPPSQCISLKRTTVACCPLLPFLSISEVTRLISVMPAAVLDFECPSAKILTYHGPHIQGRTHLPRKSYWILLRWMTLNIFYTIPRVCLLPGVQIVFTPFNNEVLRQIFNQLKIEYVKQWIIFSTAQWVVPTRTSLKSLNERTWHTIFGGQVTAEENPFLIRKKIWQDHSWGDCKENNGWSPPSLWCW